MYFCAGFVIVFKMVSPYIERKNTKSVEKNPPPYFDVLAFSNNEVRIVSFGEIEEFKRENPGYSFLVPKGKEDFFNEFLNDNSGFMDYSFEVRQISENTQLIRLSGDSAARSGVHVYEATAKEVFPKTVMYQNMRDTFFKSFPSAVGGLLTCLIFFLFYRKYLGK